MFEYKGHIYEPTALLTGRKRGAALKHHGLFEHRVHLPDGGVTLAPFNRRYLADRSLFNDWVRCRLVPLWEVDGWSYQPEALHKWSTHARHYRHMVRSPQKEMIELSYARAKMMPPGILRQWLEWHQPDPKIFGSRLLTNGFFTRIERTARKHDIAPHKHKLIAVFEKLSAP